MFSISLDVCEIKENQEVCESCVESINGMIRGFFSKPVMSLSDAESRTFEGFRINTFQMLLRLWITCTPNLINFTHPI